jgi:hypothetical protein
MVNVNIQEIVFRAAKKENGCRIAELDNKNRRKSHGKKAFGR